MPSKWLFPRKSAAATPRASLAAFILALFAVSLLFGENANSVEAETPPENAPPGAKASFGPRDTDFNSQGYRICKVVRMERSLNALGIAALFGKTNKVGKYVELPKRLEPSERGERFLITWKYSGKNRTPKTVLKFHYKLSNEERLETLTREYPDLKRGRYRLRIEHTGPNYRRRGRIEYWRISLFADGELVARKESFLWPLFQGDKEVQSREGA